MSNTPARYALAAAALIWAAGCGAPGLPPAGPAPGEVEIGYGTQDADKVTGAVSSLTDDEMGEGRPIVFEELLRGRVPGLHIMRQGATLILRLRGTDSLLFPQEPLFVVDGFPMSSILARETLEGLTTRDIRQIDVLRDISSTSIYGSRAAGGVIVINTHR